MVIHVELHTVLHMLVEYDLRMQPMHYVLQQLNTIEIINEQQLVKKKYIKHMVEKIIKIQNYSIQFSYLNYQQFIFSFIKKLKKSKEKKKV